LEDPGETLGKTWHAVPATPFSSNRFLLGRSSVEAEGMFGRLTSSIGYVLA
jgi:hypothetical protein